MSLLRRIFLLDSGENIINPAKEDGNLAGVKSNTDKLDVPLSTVGSQVTSAAILAQLDITTSALRDAITAAAPNNKTLADLYERLNSIRTQFDVVLSTRASEATLVQVRDYLDTVETLLGSILTQLDVTLSTRASEVTLATRASEATLSTRASEATLIQVRDYLDTVETKLQAIIDKLNADLDVNLHDGAGNGITSTDEGGGVRSLDVSVKSGDISIDEVGIKDAGDNRINPAKEDGNLENIKDAIGEVQETPTQYTVLDRLKQIWVKLVDGINVTIAGAPPDERLRLYRREVFTKAMGKPYVWLTYTVPAGKYLDISTWQLGTEGGETLVALIVNGVEEDAIRFSEYTVSVRETISYGSYSIRATAGQVVEIKIISGDTNKEYIAGLTGRVVDV